MSISESDRRILRETAKQAAELAFSERNRKLYEEWVRFGNEKHPERVMFRVELGTFEHEVLPDMMKCEGKQARNIERRILGPIANFTLFEDDTLVPDYYPVGLHMSFLPFNLPVRRQETGGVGHHFIPYLEDLEEDEHKLGRSAFGWDVVETESEAEQAEEIFGDILPVRIVGGCMVCSPMQNIVHIMNMDDMYVAMLQDKPRFHHMMRMQMNDYREWYRQMEKAGVLRSAAREQHLCQGSYCFTGELPEDRSGAKLKDIWLYMDSQETSGVSPELYAEMVFPYYKELMAMFGLVSYGCCEACDPIWDNCLSGIGNLRKVSISPWCNEEFMGERLQNTDVTFLRKPPATILGMNEPLDEEETRKCFEKTREAAKGCKLEIAQRDVYQIHHDPGKVHRYVEIAREVFDH